MINTTEIAKQLGVRHKDITTILKKVTQDIVGTKYELMADIEEVEDTYRNQPFVSYAVNEFVHLFILSRVRNVKSIERLEEVFIQYEQTTTLLDSVIDKFSKAEDEVARLKIFKDVFMADMHSKEGVSNKPELVFHKKVVVNFERYFPEYVYVQSEYRLKDNDLVDILAKDKLTGKDVVIELKIKPISAHKQLRSYSYNFNNPILVNFTPTPVKESLRVDGIVYRSEEDTVESKRVRPSYLRLGTEE